MRKPTCGTLFAILLTLALIAAPITIYITQGA